MYILCIETSTTNGEIAIFQNKNCLAISTWGKEATHSEVLTLKYEQILKDINFDPKLFTDIIVSYGPGSFTGLRVGLNFAKSIAYSYDIPIYLSPSFRGVLDPDSLSKNINLLIVRPALQNKFYVAHYFLDTSNIIVEKVLPETLTPALIEKSFFDVENLNIQAPESLTAPSVWTENFRKKVTFTTEPERFNYCLNHLHYFLNPKEGLNFEKSDWQSAYPLYIRASEAEEKMKLGDLKIHKKRTL